MDRIDKLKNFLASQPNDAFLLHALALEHVKRNEDEQARTLFNRVLAADPLYTGTYYHLAKLLERSGDRDAAVNTYEIGMEACKKAGDDHAYRELQNAYEDLIY
jgi:Tfp pilus assembly protein PilF